MAKSEFTARVAQVEVELGMSVSKADKERLDTIAKLLEGK